MQGKAKVITRFAPSPTGPLHLGHAYSAILAHTRAKSAGGQFLLRIEDGDPARCRPEWEDLIYQDLDWLGLDWQRPVWRISDRTADYSAALDRLTDMGLTYPCSCTRRDIAEAHGAPQGDLPIGPDGVIYPGTCRKRHGTHAGPNDAIRLDMARAIALLGPDRRLTYRETGPYGTGIHFIDLDALQTKVGDVVLFRRDTGMAAYHLTVVVDDAAQGITEAVRGADLIPATQIHRLLQALLGLTTPDYHHHRLICDEAGKRLAKRNDAKAIRKYRDEGLSPADVRQLIGL